MKNAPTNLDELLTQVRKYFQGPYLPHEPYWEPEWEDHRATPPWNGARMNWGELDMTSLPTFGGMVPVETSGIWSWDSTRLLVGVGVDDLKIIDRKGEER